MQIVIEEKEHPNEAVEAAVEAVAEKEAAEAPQISDLARFLKRTRAVVPVAVVGMFLLGIVAALHFGRPFLMPIVLAGLLTFLLKPIVRALTGLRLPEALSALLVIIVFFTVVFFSVSKLVQPAAQWASRAPEMMVKVRERYEKIFRRAERLSRAAAEVQDITKPVTTTEPQTPQVEVKQPTVLMASVLTFTKSFAAGLIETVVLLFFMLAAGDLFMQKLVRVLPTLHDKKKAVEIAHELQQNLSTFLFTITTINVALGVLVGLAAFWVGLPNPVLWGVLAGALNFIPYFGPITGVAVLLVAGFLTFDSPMRALAPSAIYLSLHAVESNFITPMILGRRLTLNPLVIFISLMFWTWLWGIPGALLSIPMLMMLKIFCDHFKPMAPIGEFLSG
jgi:predicted PurR-regulated permease PerM